MGRKAPGSSLTCRGHLGAPPSGREMSPRQVVRTTMRGRPPASRRARSRLAQATSPSRPKQADSPGRLPAVSRMMFSVRLLPLALR